MPLLCNHKSSAGNRGNKPGNFKFRKSDGNHRGRKLCKIRNFVGAFGRSVQNLINGGSVFRKPRRQRFFNCLRLFFDPVASCFGIFFDFSFIYLLKSKMRGNVLAEFRKNILCIRNGDRTAS